MRTLALALLLFVSACTTTPRDDAPLSWSDPSDVGFSSEKLAAIGPAMEAFVDRGEVAGVTTLVARDGRLVHWQSVGLRDIEGGDPLDRDDIFRIASMTKPITSIGIMMLVEEGALELDGALADTLPEFADVQVLVDDELVLPVRPITIRDLLRHTSGFTYGFFGQTRVDVMYREAGLFRGNLEQLTNGVAELPLLAQPGTAWTYSVSTDVLGRVIEVVSGQSLDEFFRARLFEPLGMIDTAFFVAPEKTSRFTVQYRVQDGALVVGDPATGGRYNAPPRLLSGGGGLTSTALDYARFAQMLLSGGEVDGVRILHRETVDLMRSNQLPDTLVPIPFRITKLTGDFGFGLGFAVLMDADTSPDPDHDGVYRWWGYGSTYFWIDPVAELIGIVMTPLSPPTAPEIEKVFQRMVYEAMTR